MRNEKKKKGSYTVEDQDETPPLGISVKKNFTRLSFQYGASDSQRLL